MPPHFRLNNTISSMRIHLYPQTIRPLSSSSSSSSTCLPPSLLPLLSSHLQQCRLPTSIATNRCGQTDNSAIGKSALAKSVWQSVCSCGGAHRRSSSTAAPSVAQLPVVVEQGGGHVDREGEGGVEGKYLLKFTCNVCQTTAAKRFSKLSYHHGVVIIRCPGCRKLHLVADRLGWFGDKPESIEDFLEANGQTLVKKVGDVSLLNIEGLISDDSVRPAN
eukprot:GHVS01078969.1.p1 GENE.GHVS01078969.1~~GHVS01078969.1.p1  ORF type:complete len:219 (+),score=50.87 GHVS01078969.1:219-875(+)